MKYIVSRARNIKKVQYYTETTSLPISAQKVH